MLSIRTLSALLAFSAIGLAAPAPADTKATEEPIWEDDTLWNGFLARACVENHQSREDVFKVWEDQNCVLAALGTNTGSQPVDRFLLFNFEDTIDNIPLSAEIPAPSEEVLAEHFHLDTKTSISEENLGYAYFGALQESDEKPASWELKYMFENIASWTGYCEESDIPLSEVARYIQSSSTVNGTACGIEPTLT